VRFFVLHRLRRKVRHIGQCCQHTAVSEDVKSLLSSKQFGRNRADLKELQSLP
jgi:hypothetical protein